MYLCLFEYELDTESLDESDKLDLYYAADKHEIRVRMEKCCNFIEKSLFPNEHLPSSPLAVNHGDSDLLDHILRLFLRKIAEYFAY